MKPSIHKSWAWPATCAATLAGAFFLAGAARTQDDPVPAEQLDELRTVLQETVETRRLISKEKRDWAIGREVLADRIELLEAEIGSLRTSIDEANSSISDADKKRADLLEENEQLKSATSSLEEAVVALEDRTRGLLVRLPDPIRERVRPLSQRLPEDSNDTELGLGERFQNLVGVLNEVNKFQREVTVTSEVRTLENGTSAEVTAMYFGLGRAFYANADATLGGIGTSGPEGWVWSPANESAEAIALAIAIQQNEEVAEFVQLPVQID